MTALPGGYPDASVQEAEARDRLQSAAVPLNLAAWDASDDARRDATPDARPEPPDADAEKLVVLEPAFPAQDAMLSERLASALHLAVSAVHLAAEPCKPDAVPSAARSFADREPAA